MYIVTFYSYKGGVGRTMTLMNVAAELVKRGRRVMIVDFDLEAPGLTTYGYCQSAATKPGVVDYICEYSRTLVAPDVRNYVTQCKFSGDERNSEEVQKNEFFVMSAGRQDEKYRDNFYSIDWESLYSEKSGYLMMEDLKEQWKAYFDPDYVFIDSRTGITDISGICTRQFPDAVAITFFPNRQNLSGLKRIVNEIRLEKDGTRQKDITLHFISSNTPSADDEDGILKRNLDEFKSELQYEVGTIIHYYNSLSIVEQMIFTLHKPKTQLAEEYRHLVNEIVKCNAEDREGALAYLHDLASDQEAATRLGGLSEIDKRLTILRQHYGNDGEILNRIGDVNVTLLRNEDAIDLYKEAIQNGFRTAETFRNLAISYRQAEGSKSDTLNALANLLEQSDASFIDVFFAMKWIIEIDSSHIQSAIHSPAVRDRSTKEKYVITDHVLRTSPTLLPLALLLIDEIQRDPKFDEADADSVNGLKYQTYIAMGRFSDALNLMDDREHLIASNAIHKIFNRAMAEWGALGKPPADLFARTIELNSEVVNRDIKKDANYPQCIGLAHWAIGEPEKAREWLEKARKMALPLSRTKRILSCWRYLNVTKVEFLRDVDCIERLIEGEDLLPEFMQVPERSALH